MSCHCYPFAIFVCSSGFQRPTDECAKKPTLTNIARSHPAHALNNIWNLPCFCHWMHAFGPGCGSLALWLYVFSQHTFSYPTDHLREYLNNNNFTKLFSQTKDIFHLTGHALSCARQPNNIYSNPMNEIQPKIYTYRMSFKILFKVTTIMRHAWQKNGNKTHITGSFFIIRTCVCVCVCTSDGLVCAEQKYSNSWKHHLCLLKFVCKLKTILAKISKSSGPIGILESFRVYYANWKCVDIHFQFIGII